MIPESNRERSGRDKQTAFFVRSGLNGHRGVVMAQKHSRHSQRGDPAVREGSGRFYTKGRRGGLIGRRGTTGNGRRDRTSPEMGVDGLGKDRTTTIMRRNYYVG